MIAGVVRNGIWLGAGEAAVKGGLLAVAVLIARGSGPAGVGTFSIAFGAALIGIMVLAFGQQEVLIREVARAPDRARSLLSESHSFQRRLTMWLLPAVAAAIFMISDSSLRLTLLAFVPYVVLRTSVVTRGAVFKGLDRMDVEVRARALEISIAVVGCAVGAFLAWPVWTVGVSFSLGAGLGLMWIERRSRTFGLDQSSAPPTPVLREGLPFMALAVLGQLLVNTDRFLLAGLGIARTEIGFWGAAGTIVWALVALPQLVAVAAYPTFSRLAERGDSWRRAGLVSMGCGASAGLACALLLREIAKPLVGIVFGPDFSPAVPLLERLSLVLPAAFGMMVVGTVFAAWRRQILAMWALVAAFGLSVALNLAWIPVIGAMACANAAIAAYSVAAVVMTILVFAAAGRGSKTA